VGDTTGETKTTVSTPASDTAEEVAVGGNLVRAKRPLARFISGSGDFPRKSIASVGGTEEAPVSRPSSYRSQSASNDGLARHRSVEDRASTWDDIQSLPTLSEAPLLADDIREIAPFDPSAHREPPREARVDVPLTDRAATGTLEPRRIRWMHVWRVVVGLISVIVLLAGVALLLLALLSPPRPERPQTGLFEASPPPEMLVEHSG
jgi:hypothetical protein